MKEVVFTPAGLRQWTKLSAEVRSRIRRKLMEFAETRQGDVKRLKDRRGVRLRVGDWRLIFEEGPDQIIVYAVGHRREIYD
ncbi:MAG: type II toxin-antitoxin system RelE/ParE family toxin [Devosia sp.]